MLKGRGTQCFGVVLAWELEVLAILKGEVQKVSALTLSLIEGGGCAKRYGPAIL